MSGGRIIDPYSEADELIASLRRAGFRAEADTLREAIDSGSTGTEIFMALRWHLEGLLKKGLPDDLRAQASRLEAFLARA